jgi:hypothetical protein
VEAIAEGAGAGLSGGEFFAGGDELSALVQWHAGSDANGFPNLLPISNRGRLGLFVVFSHWCEWADG